MNNYNKRSEQINTSKQVDQSMIRRILMVLFGLVETMLGFRFVFKLAGANPANALIKMLYDITEPIVGVFANIFTPATTDGLETASVFEPGTLIAMVIIALIAIAIGKLMPNNTQVQKYTTEHVNNTNHTNNSSHINKSDNVNRINNMNDTDPYKANPNHVNHTDNVSDTDPYTKNTGNVKHTDNVNDTDPYTKTTDHVNHTVKVNDTDPYTKTTDHVNNTDHVNSTDNLSNTDPYKNTVNTDNKGDLK